MEKLWHETKQPTGREKRNDKYSNTEISKNSQTFLTKITRKTVLLYQTITLIYFLENMYWMSQVYRWKRVYLPIYISALVQKILKVALKGITVTLCNTVKVLNILLSPKASCFQTWFNILHVFSPLLGEYIRFSLL